MTTVSVSARLNDPAGPVSAASWVPFFGRAAGREDRHGGQFHHRLLKCFPISFPSSFCGPRSV